MKRLEEYPNRHTELSSGDWQLGVVLSTQQVGFQWYFKETKSAIPIYLSSGLTGGLSTFPPGANQAYVQASTGTLSGGGTISLGTSLSGGVGGVRMSISGTVAITNAVKNDFVTLALGSSVRFFASSRF